MKYNKRGKNMQVKVSVECKVKGDILIEIPESTDNVIDYIDKYLERNFDFIEVDTDPYMHTVELNEIIDYEVVED